MLVLHAIVSMGPARRCAQMRGRAAQRTICIDIWNLLGKFGNDQEHSVTHVQRLPAAAAAARVDTGRQVAAAFLGAKQNWRTPGDEAGG